VENRSLSNKTPKILGQSGFAPPHDGSICGAIHELCHVEDHVATCTCGDKQFRSPKRFEANRSFRRIHFIEKESELIDNAFLAWQPIEPDRGLLRAKLSCTDPNAYLSIQQKPLCIVNIPGGRAESRDFNIPSKGLVRKDKPADAIASDLDTGLSQANVCVQKRENKGGPMK
jgi:hypothetical protein